MRAMTFFFFVILTLWIEDRKKNTSEHLNVIVVNISVFGISQSNTDYRVQGTIQRKSKSNNYEGILLVVWRKSYCLRMAPKPPSTPEAVTINYPLWLTSRCLKPLFRSFGGFERWSLYVASLCAAIIRKPKLCSRTAKYGFCFFKDKFEGWEGGV